jgi:hypothetical protein
MADDLAKNLIDHRHVCFAANVIAELRLNHREYRLDVAAFVVVAQKLFAALLEVVEHLGPQAAAASVVDALESDVGNRAMTRDGGIVVQATVALVG